MNRKNDCTFCRKDFPKDYQLVSKDPPNWLFILNRDPQCDYHAIIVLKAKTIEKYGHISDLCDDRLPDDAVRELGLLLKKAGMSIKKTDPTVEKILIASLNTGEATQHLHFHLIPKRYSEPVKVINKPCVDGGGMLFLARKEIVVDTFSDFPASTTGDNADKLMHDIKIAKKKRVTENAYRLQRNFKWR